MPSLYNLPKGLMMGSLDAVVTPWKPSLACSKEFQQHDWLKMSFMLMIHRVSANYFALVPREPLPDHGIVDARGALESDAPDMLLDDEFNRANDMCRVLFGRTLTRKEVCSLPRHAPLLGFSRHTLS